MTTCTKKFRAYFRHPYDEAFIIFDTLKKNAALFWLENQDSIINAVWLKSINLSNWKMFRILFLFHHAKLQQWGLHFCGIYRLCTQCQGFSKEHDSRSSEKIFQRRAYSGWRSLPAHRVVFEAFERWCTFVKSSRSTGFNKKLSQSTRVLARNAFGLWKGKFWWLKHLEAYDSLEKKMHLIFWNN